MSRDKVILVDENNDEIGVCDKLEAHQKGLLHRAFSILVYNADGEVLLQKRAQHKYHSGGLWSNTCCSHPQPDESMETAIHNRLQEEMGFDCELRHIGDFIYKTTFENGLIEHELDSVFCGQFDGTPTLNPDEAEAYEWKSIAALKSEMLTWPALFTFWMTEVVAIFEPYKKLSESL